MPFTHGLEEVDERFLLDYYNWHVGDVRGLEKGIHRCHDLVKTPTETSQGHDHVNLSKESQIRSHICEQCKTM